MMSFFSSCCKAYESVPGTQLSYNTGPMTALCAWLWERLCRASGQRDCVITLKCILREAIQRIYMACICSRTPYEHSISWYVPRGKTFNNKISTKLTVVPPPPCHSLWVGIAFHPRGYIIRILVHVVSITCRCPTANHQVGIINVNTHPRVYMPRASISSHGWGGWSVIARERSDRGGQERI